MEKLGQEELDKIARAVAKFDEITAAYPCSVGKVSPLLASIVTICITFVGVQATSR